MMSAACLLWAIYLSPQRNRPEDLSSGLFYFNRSLGVYSYGSSGGGMTTGGLISTRPLRMSVVFRVS